MFFVGKGALMIALGWAMMSPLGNIFGFSGVAVTLAHWLALVSLSVLFHIAARMNPPPSGSGNDNSEKGA